MTFSTQLTLLRMVLGLVIVGCMLIEGISAKILACSLFAVAGITDWLDGYLARRWSQESELGALLDPIADKVLVLGIFFAAVQVGSVALWMVAVIVLREVLITGVRLIAARRGLVLSAALEGKLKTVSQMIAIAFLLLALLFDELAAAGYLSESWRLHMAWILAASMWLAVVLTLYSGGAFFVRHARALASLRQ